MITSAFLLISAYILNLLFDFFPDSTGFSSDFITAFDTIGGYMVLIGTLVPLPILAQCVTLVITFELSVFAFKGLRFVLSYFPLFGGRG